jgi:apolipoprotein N-acyltransferase
LNKKFYIEAIFLVILGIVTSFSLPPFNYFIINFLTFSLLFLFLIKKSNQYKSKNFFFIYGWFFGLGYFITNLYWISISLTFDQNYKFLIPLAIFLIPAFLAIFYGLVTYLFILFKPQNTVSSFLVFSLIFGIVEFARGSILTGFPWNLIVYSFSGQLEVLGIISIIGTYGFNLFCISLFTAPALLVLRDTKKEIGVCVFFIISIIFFYFYGSFYKEKFNHAEKADYEYKIRVIGSNIGLERFYTNTDTVSVVQELIEISSPDITEKMIFIWPEGILPGVHQKQLIEYRELFKNSFNENHFLIIGINGIFEKNGSIDYYNSLSLYDYQLNLLDSYNKINLVPFGEFLPLENILKNIGLRSLTNNYQSFTSGEQRNIIDIKKKNFILKILPLICYEIIYSGKLSNNLDFDLIVNISEDGWFGQSIGPKQHFAHSIFRAIESGKYVIRSANNGIAAIINPLGELEQSINFGQTGYVDFEENKIIQPTIFSKYRNKIFGLLILLYIFLIFSFNKIRNE